MPLSLLLEPTSCTCCNYMVSIEMIRGRRSYQSNHSCGLFTLSAREWVVYPDVEFPKAAGVGIDASGTICVALNVMA